MKKKQLSFIKKKSNFWVFFSLSAIIVATNIGLLIATSWYSIDYKIAEEISKGLTTEFGKYWTRFYDAAGRTELITVIMIYIAILFETVFLTKISQKKDKWKKNYWIVNGYYIVVIVGWFLFNTIKITLTAIGTSVFGKGIDFVLLDSIKYLVTGGIIAFAYQTVILFLGLYYVRYKLVKTNRILKEQYWLKSIKVFTFFILCYIVIIIPLKGTMSRLYYFNAIFGDLFEKLPKDLQDNYLASGARLGYGPNHINNIPDYLQYPWWKSSLPLKSDPNMPYYSLPWLYAFPSGHMNAFFGGGALILLFFKNKNNEKINWKIKICFIIWLIHLLSMNFALIMERMHWISDTAFSIIILSLMALIVHFSINKIFAKIIK